MEHPAVHPLALARRARGLSQEQLAARIRDSAARRGLRSGTDASRIRKWERGIQPDKDSQTYLAEALGLPASVIDGPWPDWLPLTDTGVVPLAPHATVPALREALRTVDRRTFLTVSSAALTTLTADWASAHSTKILSAQFATDGDLVDVLQTTAQQLTAADPAHHPHTTRLLHENLATVTDLLDHGSHSAATRHRLHTLAADIAHTLAWRRFDHGDNAHAAQYWIAALHNSHAIGDTDRGAGLISDLAYQAAWQGDHVLAGQLLTHALSRATHPAARSLLQLRLARTHAARHETRPALRALAAAEKHMNQTAGDRPAWCAWLSDADLAIDSGQALLDLGDTARARQLITDGEHLLPTPRSKTRGIFLAYQAASHLDLKEPEPAAAAAHSLQLARSIRAPRCIRLVEDLIPRFQPYRGTPGVTELLHLAAA
ncbi:helix-turn-helix transcriptional regulator [Streptomyces sp. NPDC032940]|uniref:helix-turn-helix domain-containing protein n=1 Tax=Streptomyces sp. NPDC032940 TaxID=3155366 RepID=UPI0033CE3B4E